MNGVTGSQRRTGKGCPASAGARAGDSIESLSRGLISDSELERREQNLIDRNTPLTEEEKTRARELESRGLDRDTIALKLGWTMRRLVMALRQKRDCLRCGREFTSDGIYERICPSCRQTNASEVSVIPTAECDFVPRSNPGRGRKDA